MSKTVPDMREELAAAEAGYRCVCGIDEAGRGPLAGPVVAAAVILPIGFCLPGLTDSKQLTAKKREHFFDVLMQDAAVRKFVARAEVGEIDRLNILRATHLAMRRAAEGLGEPRPDLCLIDGLPVPGFPMLHKALVRGDTFCLSISAAGVLAKVTRDRIMRELHNFYPEYGWNRNAGYGTPAHLRAIQNYGITPYHRRSFAPVAQAALPLEF